MQQENDDREKRMIRGKLAGKEADRREDGQEGG